MVAAAVIGGAVVSAGGSMIGGKMAGDAASDGAASAANATIQSTQMQVDETGRQFDYQQQLLAPLVNQQYGAGSAFSDLMGVNQTGTDDQRNAELTDLQGQLETLENNRLGYADGSGGRGPESTRYGRPEAETALLSRITELQDPNTPYYPGPGSSPTETGDRGQFIDTNIDQTRLQDIQQLPGQVQNTLMAGTSAEDDPFRNYLQDNRIAAGTSAEDARVMRADQVRNAGPNLAGDMYRQDVAGRQLQDGAAGTGVYGENFQSSPGYSFQVEEMGRELDRKNSAGGNYGGRAMMEAQRRAIGLANTDYYNWAAGRTSDLERQAGAEATDASRMDETARNYLDRQQVDIGRGDLALSQYEGQRVQDVGRDDLGYMNYMDRQIGDNARMDSAIGESDRLAAVDQQRGDQSYYNYMGNLSRMAGFGDATGQAVNSSQGASAAVSGAYANQGNNLSAIYSQDGVNQANIAIGTASNVNDSVQSGISNYMAMDG